MAETALSLAQVRQAPPLPPAFYLRSASEVGPELIGKVLVHRLGRLWLAARIVEVEAYLGEHDPASHTYCGPTQRNRSMYAAGGTCYVYLSYGMHHCMNVVTERAGIGQGCLIRAVEPLLNIAAMAERRALPAALSTPKALRLLGNGPGKLTKALGIGPEHDGQRFDQRDLKLIEVLSLPRLTVTASPRIGISKAVDLPLRFTAAGSPFLSRR